MGGMRAREGLMCVVFWPEARFDNIVLKNKIKQEIGKYNCYARIGF